MFTALNKKFLVITPSLASAFAQTTSTITTSAQPSSSSLSLPSNLQALIPQCAQSCVESVLFDEWPLGCSSSGDLECLCSQYSTTGLTLGEAAYACAVTSCPSSTSDLASTYSICSGQDGAVVATHSTLTFTAHITSTADTTTAGSSGASSTSTSSTTTRTNTTSTLSSSTSSKSRTSSRLSSSSETSASPTSTTTSAAASTTASPSSAKASATAAAAGSSSASHGTSLSTAQIIGISVASVSAVILAVGVLFLLACLRKRDRKKLEDPPEKQGKSMWALTPPSHDDVVLSPTALEQFPSPPRNRKDPRGGGGVGIAIPHLRVEGATPPRQRAHTPLENIGLAITEDTPMASPASFSSNRTLSQLLPDKPEPVLPRPPAAVPTSTPFIAKKKKSSRPESSMTVFEEDTTVRKSMHPVRAVEVPPRPQQPPIRPYRPPPSYAQGYTPSPQNTRQPPLSLAIPPQGKQVPSQPRPSPPPIPSPLRIAKPPFVQPPDPQSASSGSTKFTGTNSTASSSYIPAYYTSPPTSIMQTPPESYGQGGPGAAFSGPSPQVRQAQTRAPPVAAVQQTSVLPPQSAHANHRPAPRQQQQVTNNPPPPLPALRQSPPVNRQSDEPASGPSRPGQQQPVVAKPPSSTTAHPHNQYPRAPPPLPPPPPQSTSPSQHERQRAGQRPPPPRPQRSTSSASMTSIECDDYYADVTPPEEDDASNNVVVAGGGDSSSPPTALPAADRSPSISDIKYPKIPRASNQAVPRTSPNQPASSSSRVGTPSPRVKQVGTPSPRVKQQQGGSSSPPAAGTSSPGGGLLARRGGGNGLLLIDSGGNDRTTAAPRTPPGQTSTDPDQARKSSAALPPVVQWGGGGGEGDVQIKTPLWVPRLTPTRRGEEMVLAVAYNREGKGNGGR